AVVAGELGVEGAAQIDLDTAAPYWTAKEADLSSAASEYNARAQENLDDLTALIRSLAEAVSQSSVKVFTDYGWAFPWNAHCAFFSGPSAVIDDLKLIAKLWDQGAPGYQPMPPLRRYDSKFHVLALRELSPPDHR